ncbi:hypothetical protein PYW07_011034 [Mythimna separata]|uniref:Mediator of RNA polymerase II transcription subunit 26 n=1 Tax=Mythimna separata TaxID=271217 RepID=A0AAD8DK37_MYTSE|nr:hypothetical protein PYW07_011034 [Mythimna separata]
MSNNAHELSNRLLNALDNNYNVVDMHTVNEIISVLERINITKELLETTRLGKHVNELRRKTTDPSLARRAKVLVKRWRDLVIPTVASPGHTGISSNRSSAERTTVRARLGGTPLTSPALSRQVVSPAVNSPRPPSRPAWGGYESDSQDVILVDDEPSPAPAPPLPPAPSLLANTHKPLTPPVRRPPSPEPLFDEKKAKRDKKPKRKRGHSRAGSGTEATGPVAAAAAAPLAPSAPLGPAGPAGAWAGRNGTHERRRNGTKRDALDSYAALVNRMPPAGAKKVKTTKELLEQIQSRGSKPAASPASPRSPASPDVMLIEPDIVKVDSPLRNGSTTPRPPSPPASPVAPMSPLEEPREYHPCTCGDAPDDACPAAATLAVRPRHVHALHHAHVPGVNGTRAPALPHRFAVRAPEHPERPGLFSSVVPLYKYSDYADDYCAKNMSQVTLCAHLPWSSFAPPPPDLPPPPEPPPLRPYPEPEPEPNETGEDAEEEDVKPEVKREPAVKEEIEVEAEMVGVPTLSASERLKAPILMPEDEKSFGVTVPTDSAAVEQHATAAPQHRSVPRTKEPLPGGAALVAAVRAASDAVPYRYEEFLCAPVLPRSALRSDSELDAALVSADTARDALGRPVPARKFAEWHECASLGELIALPYVVID